MIVRRICAWCIGSRTYYYQAICPITTILSGKSGKIPDNSEISGNSGIMPDYPCSGESGKIHYKWNILANHLD
jgi:hypothetical protein